MLDAVLTATPSSEVALMRRIASGDDAAMRELMDRHLDVLYRFARHTLAGRDGAEDAVATTLGRAHAAAHRFDGRSELRTWLLAILWREIGKVRRRRFWLPLPEDRAGPERDIGDAAWIDVALRSLSHDQRAAFSLVHVEELSIAEAASALGIPEGTVKSRVSAAKAHLRRKMGDPS